MYGRWHLLCTKYFCESAQKNTTRRLKLCTARKNGMNKVMWRDESEKESFAKKRTEKRDGDDLKNVLQEGQGFVSREGGKKFWPRKNIWNPSRYLAVKKKKKKSIKRWTNLLNKSLTSADRSNKATLLLTVLRSIQVVCKGFTPAYISNAIHR